MNLHHWLVGLVNLAAFGSAAAVGAVRIEAESDQAPKPGGATVVDDKDVSGGKALLLLGEKKAPLSDAIECKFPIQEAAGTYKLTLRMRLEGAYDIGRAWRADVTCDGRIVGYGVAQGYYFKADKGYRDFHIPFRLLEAGKPPTVRMYWAFDGWYAPCTSKPRVYLDWLEIARTADLPPVQITSVVPNKIRYLRQEKGTAAVEVRNTTSRPVEAKVAVELLHDLAPPVPLVTQTVEMAPGRTASIEAPFQCSDYFQGEAADYGYELRATASVAGRPIDFASEYFCVCDNPFAVATHMGPFGGENDPPDPAEYFFDNRWRRKFNEAVLSDEDARRGALAARREYLTCWEWYSWSHGGCLDMAPREDLWLDGDTSLRIVGKRKLQKGVAELKKYGIASVSYILPYGQGLTSLDLIARHPDWFVTSRDTNDFTLYGYDVGLFGKQREFLRKYDLAKLPTNNGYMTPKPEPIDAPAYFQLNFAKPEVLDYVIEQTIASVRMFGWEGVRWDCGHLNTGIMHGPWQPFLDFFGKPLCDTPQEMVAQTVANVRKFRDRLTQAFPPYFAFGTNYGSVEETHRYPEMTRELCRDGGWLLDEVSYTYHTPQSAYRFWDKYYAVMAEQGNYTAAMGGHYYPFAPTRFGSPYPADRIYTTVFGLAGHGHPNLFFRNSCFVAGDPAQLAVRFGRFLFDTKLLRVDKPGEMIQVSAGRPLWWDKSVWRKSEAGKDTLVVHLINPPASKAIVEDETSALPPSAKEVKVSFAMPSGRKLTAAWAAMAESWTSDLSAKTQAVVLDATVSPGVATVSIPEVIIWKMIVVQIE